MRILFVHNHYGDGVRGGEEWLVRRQSMLLRSNGHEVQEYYRKNSEFIRKPLWQRLTQFRNLIWSKTSYYDVQKQIEEFKPDIMHVHNFWMILSPSIFRAAHDKGVATVLSLNNYRLAGCVSGLMLRNGKPCKLCAGRNPWRSILYGCYGGRRTRSLVKYMMYDRSKREGVWESEVDAFVASTEFGRRAFIAGGLPAGKVYMMPEFAQDPLEGGGISPGRGAIVVGRLSPEKGLHTLLKAWQAIDYPLTVVGEGPLRAELERKAPAQVKFTGFLEDRELGELRLRSAFTVFPSECYEGFGSVMVESLASGRAVIACNLGGRAEVIQHGENGLLYNPGDANDLRCKVIEMLKDPQKIQTMGFNARQTYVNKYTVEQGYKSLIDIYKKVVSSKRFHDSDRVNRSSTPS
ncbi:MAG: glycosyltransferase family 4 protein [Thermodesulfobacteriota bacterium]